MAAVYDGMTRKIPNFVVAVIVITGFIDNVWQKGWYYAAESLGLMLVICVIMYPLFLLGALGGGDVKLYATLPYFCNKGHILQLYLIVFCVGAVLGIRNLLNTSDKGNRSNHIVDIPESRISSQCKKNDRVLSAQKYTIPMAIPYSIGIAIAVFLELRGIYSFF